MLIRHLYLTSKDWIRNSVLRTLGGKSVGVRALVVNEQEEILLVRHTYQDGLRTPGGGVQKGETPLAAIRRELLEEVGIELTLPPTPFAVYRNSWRGIDDYPVLYVVRCFYGVPHPADKAEISEVRWVSSSNLPEDVTPRTLIRLREYWGQAEIQEVW